MKFLTLILTLLSLLLSYHFARAQYDIDFSNLSIKDGLSQSSVDHILQDSYGVMWFATQVGVDKYDGKEFVSIKRIEKPLTQNIQTIFEYPQHNSIIVIVGRNLYEIKKDKTSAELINSVLPNEILHVGPHPDSDSLLFFGSKSIFSSSFNFKEFKEEIKLEYQIKKVIYDKDQQQYYLLTNNGVFLFSNEDLKKKTLKSPIIQGEYSSIVRKGDILYLGRGKLMIDVFIKDNATGSYIKLNNSIDLYGKIKNSNKNVLANEVAVESFIKPYDVIDQLVVQDSLLWIGTAQSGLYGYNLNKEATLIICHAHCKIHGIDLSSNRIRSLFISHDDVLWVGTEAGGINFTHIGKQTFDHHAKGDELQTSEISIRKIKGYDNKIWSVLPIDNSNILVGTESEGVSLINTSFDLLRQRIRPIDALVGSEKVYSLYRPTSNSKKIYIGTAKGIYWVFKDDLDIDKDDVTYQMTPYKDSASIMVYDSLESIWLVGQRGNDRVNVLNENLNKINSFKVPQGSISSITIIDGNYWLPTTNGVYIFEESNSEYVIKDSILQGIHIVSLVYIRERSEVWMGTDRKGLFKGKYEEGKLKRDNIDKIPNAKLDEEVIYSLIDDTKGSIWFSTNRGIYSIDTKNKDFMRFREEDGLQSDEFNMGAVSQYDIQDRRRIYFGGINGVTSFIPKKKDDSPANEKLLIRYKHASIEEKEFIFYANSALLSQGSVIDLPNEFDYLEIEPIIMNYRDQTNNRVRLRLKGKEDWKEVDDGKFNLTAKDLNSPWRENILQIQYKTGETRWSDLKNIKIERTKMSFRTAFLTSLLVILGIILFFGYWTNEEWKELSNVQDQINEISRLESADRINETALGHFVDKFGFDYAIIFFVDVYKREISSQKELFNSNEKKIPYSEKWIKDTHFNLDNDEDILVQIVNEKQDAILIGSEIYGSTISNASLDEKIYRENKHNQLARLFLPIIHRTSHEKEKEDQKNDEIEQDDIVLGVVEVGYKRNLFSIVFSSILKFFPFKKLNYFERLKKRKVQMKLYVDNFAQPYYRTFIREERKRLYTDIIDVNKNRHEGHYEFIQGVLNDIAEKLRASYANVSFKTFNNDFIDLHEKEIFYGFTKEESIKGLKNYSQENTGKDGITHHVINSGKVYFTSGDISKDPYYLKVRGEINSEIGICLKDEYKEKVGVMTLSSIKEDYFNKLHAGILRKVMDRATQEFEKKKQYKTLKDLSLPFDIFSQSTTAIYFKAVKSLKEYFDAEYVSVWEIESGETLHFRLSDATEEKFRNIYEEIGLIHPKIKKVDFQETREELIDIVQVKNLKTNREKNKIVNLCEKMTFKSYVIIRIVVEGKYEAFINVFSKRELPDEFEPYTKQFLEQIAKKVALASQTIKLLTSIQLISESLSNRNSGSPLQKIVDQAYYLLPDVELVILYPYKGEEIKVGNSYRAGNFPLRDIKEPNKRANLANLIIKKGTQWIDNEGMFIDLALESSSNRDLTKTFWNTNKIKSLAAIQLSYNNQPLGILFFNYTKVKDFSTGDSRRIIEAFTNLATTALLNDDYILKIQEETNKLKIEQTVLSFQKKELEEEKAKIQFEYEKVYEKMEEMIPRVTKASYYAILQGINHDIRNFLQSLTTNLNNIRRDVKLKGKDLNLLNKEAEELEIVTESINNLLKLFKFGKTQKEEIINVEEVLKQIIKFFKGRDKLIAFHFEIDKDIPPLKSFKEEFSMIFYNLVNNAFQAIQSKGKTFHGDIKILVKYQSESETIVINVEDNGIGIDNLTLDKIFILGYSTKIHGLGIGLSFVKEIVENSFFGTIEVKSYKNKGTKFIIKIPVKN